MSNRVVSESLREFEFVKNENKEILGAAGVSDEWVSGLGCMTFFRLGTQQEKKKKKSNAG